MEVRAVNRGLDTCPPVWCRGQIYKLSAVVQYNRAGGEVERSMDAEEGVSGGAATPGSSPWAGGHEQGLRGSHVAT